MSIQPVHLGPIELGEPGRIRIETLKGAPRAYNAKRYGGKRYSKEEWRKMEREMLREIKVDQKKEDECKRRLKKEKAEQAGREKKERIRMSLERPVMTAVSASQTRLGALFDLPAKISRTVMGSMSRGVWCRAGSVSSRNGSKIALSVVYIQVRFRKCFFGCIFNFALLSPRPVIDKEFAGPADDARGEHHALTRNTAGPFVADNRFSQFPVFGTPSPPDPQRKPDHTSPSAYGPLSIPEITISGSDLEDWLAQA